MTEFPATLYQIARGAPSASFLAQQLSMQPVGQWRLADVDFFLTGSEHLHTGLVTQTATRSAGFAFDANLRNLRSAVIARDPAAAQTALEEMIQTFEAIQPHWAALRMAMRTPAFTLLTTRKQAVATVAAALERTSAKPQDPEAAASKQLEGYFSYLLRSLNDPLAEPVGRSVLRLIETRLDGIERQWGWGEEIQQVRALIAEHRQRAESSQPR